MEKKEGEQARSRTIKTLLVFIFVERPPGSP